MSALQGVLSKEEPTKGAGPGSMAVSGGRVIGSMAVAGAGPPSTRKGYAAAVSGKAANGGRRAAAPTGVLSIEIADDEKGIQADSPTGPATAEREIRQVEQHQPPFDYAA